MLQPGQCVPSTRELARQYGISRGTVLTAIEDLKAEGYLLGARGSGTFISKALPDRLLHKSIPVSSPRVAGPGELPRISDYAKRVKPLSHFVSPLSLAFRTNLPALDLFPTNLWAQVVGRRLRQSSTSHLLGCEPKGYLPLREAIAQYLRTSRGVRCEREQVVIVSGVQEAIDLVARLLLNPGDRVLMEDPGYQVAFAAFEAVGARIVSVPIDNEGAAPVQQAFHDARLVYVTPGHQFPTGVTMSLRRRVEILRRAREASSYIFEDDYDSEFRYSGSPLPSLQGIDRDNLVIFAGSFNKTLFPSLRMGYMVLPPALLEVFERTKAIVSRHHSVIDQAVICDFIEQGHFNRHLRKMRKVYAERLAALSYHSSKYLSGLLELSKIEAGLQTVGWLKTGIFAEDASSAAASKRIDVVPLSRYCHKERLQQGIQIGFAAVDESAIAKGIHSLAAVLGSLNPSKE